MDETNPYDALDQAPSAPAAAAPAQADNPYDALDSADAVDESAHHMRSALSTVDQDLPTVTVTGKRPEREATWGDVAGGIMPAIGAKLETKAAGAEEAVGSSTYGDARKKLWQSLVLPEAVRDAKDQNISLTDHPQVVDIANHLGIRPDTFTRDWPKYVNQTDQERQDFQAEQRERIQSGGSQMDTGASRRQTAAEVSALYRPNMPDYSAKSLAFDTATMIPDLMVGVGGTVATGGVGGAALMAADIAPEQYAEARNRGLNDRDASTYATLSTLAMSVPEVPVLKVLENAPGAKKIIGSVVGDKLAGTTGGKIAGTAVTQGVTQSVVQALQTGIDEGLLDEHTSLPDALKKIAWAGLTGAVVGVPMGGLHAATSREPRAPSAAPGRTEPTIGPDLGTTAANESQPGEDVYTSPGEAQPTDSQDIGNATTPGKTETAASAAREELGTKPLEGDDLHNALDAVQKKTVNPGQLASLESMGLATRSDVNVPRLLPAGRRVLTASLRERTSAAETPAEIPLNQAVSPPENTPEIHKTASQAPVEAPLEPEIQENAPEVPEKGAELPAAAVQKPITIGNRLVEDNDLRQGLTAMKSETGWAQEGGQLVRDATTNQVSGRTTWIPNADWWPNRPKGLKESEVHAAVDKALAGQPLRKGEQRMVDFMTQVHDERTAMAGIHDELKEAVPELHEQPQSAVDLTILASRASEHDADAATKVIDSWNDDHPATISRVQGELEAIIGRGQEALKAQTARGLEPAAPERSAPARDLFGEDRSKEQALADEIRRRDAARSPNKDVSLETGNPNDLFSQARQQTDLTDEAAAKKAHNDSYEKTDSAHGFKRGDIVRINDKSNQEHGNRARILGISRYGKDQEWNFRVSHEAGGQEELEAKQLQPYGQQDLTQELERARDATNAEPTDAQKEAGNYAKGTLDYGGMKVAIENPKGSQRTGVSRLGQKWSRKMHADYGYVKGTKGKDGDPVDVFLTGKADTGKVFVIDQVNPADGKFDEHKAVLGAQTADEANALYDKHYPKGWKGRDHTTELSTADFKGWVNSRDARRPLRPTARAERRTDAAQRAKVSDMSTEQLRKELLTHELTQIPNRRAYNEASKLPTQVSIDVDSLKWVNDHMGHESGNELLKAIAGSLGQHSEHAFHLSGDEFALQAHTPEEAQAVMDKVAAHLKGAAIEVEMPDGKVVTLNGLGVSYGLGTNLKEADEALQTHKNRRQAEGTRAARGEAPPGATQRARETGREDQTGGPAEKAVKNRKPKGSNKDILQDAGEKIGGARKDQWADRGMSLDDLASMTDAEAATLVTKKNVWAPDYAKMIEAGAEPHAAALVKVLYDKLATSPRKNTPEGRQHFIQTMRAIREHLGGAKTVADVKRAEDRVATDVGYGRNERNTALATEAMNRFFSVMRGRRSTLHTGYNEDKAARELVAKGFPNQEAWHSRIEIRPESGHTDQGVARVMAEAEKVGTPLMQHLVKDGIFRVQLKNRKVLGYTHTREGAEEFARKAYSTLKSRTDEGDIPERPHLDDVQRTGLPERRARDVKSEDFMHDFGFRGLEFGNWAAGDERQKLVNLAHDALGDLADVLHIPPKALSLNGTLGLALGARGTGRAAAHYEPGKLVINMTKLSGAGSLAHEWAHALDHYFGELDREDAYTTEARGATGWYGQPTTKTGENLRPEMKQAWNDLMRTMFNRDKTKAEHVRAIELRLEEQEASLTKAHDMLKATADETRQKSLRDWLPSQEKIIGVTKQQLADARGEERPAGGYGKVRTSYYKEASSLSGKQGDKGYWTRPTELFARAFESYAFDHLKEQGASSEYLVHGVEPDRYATDHYKGNPYPVEDRPAINAAIQKLVDTLQTREGESGLPTLYRRREGFDRGLPHDQMQRVVQKAIRQAGEPAGFPHVEVHETADTLPPAIRDKVYADRAELLTGAVYDPSTGRIHLIAENNANEREIQENLWHEAVGHHGLRMSMDQPTYDRIMDGINRDMPERVTAAAQRNGLDLSILDQRRAAAEEVVAYAAGQELTGQPIDKPVIPWFKQAVRAVKGFFSRMAGRPFYDDRAIAGLIQQARRALEGGTTGMTPGELARSQKAPMFYSPVERAITDSKQAKASAEQWLATLKATTGVKPEELEWLDLENWLKGHKGPISKDELGDYVRAHRLNLEETDRTDADLGDASELEERLHRLETEQTRMAEALRAQGHTVTIDHDTGEFSYIEYGPRIDRDNIPDSLKRAVRDLYGVSGQVTSTREELYFAQDRDRGEPGSTQYGDYTLPGGKDYHELLLRLPEVPESKEAGPSGWDDTHNSRSQAGSLNYQSSHWGERNIVAHVRFKEHVDPAGRRVLFLEELQSDWHQAGRKKGYSRPETLKRLAAAQSAIEEIKPAAVRAVRVDNDNLGFDSTKEALNAVRSHGDWKDRWDVPDQADRDVLDEYVKRWHELVLASAAVRHSVPEAPFKTTWPMLIMKRMVRWAADHGFERVAWTTGDQQNERYNLERHISYLTAEKIKNPVSGETLYSLSAAHPEGGRIDGLDHMLNEQELRDMVGQEMANQIVAQEMGQEQEYSGLDLRSGGEGMRGFYDQILPRETDKLIKKYGAKSGEISLGSARYQLNEPRPGEWVAYNPDDEDDWQVFKTQEAARDFIGTNNQLRVHSFDVTPEMKQAALSQGFPLFARRQADLALEERKEPGVMGAIHRAVNYAMENPVSRDLRRLIHPVGLSAESREAARVTTESLGVLAHESQQSQEALEHFSRTVDKLPVQDQLDMMDAIERGVPQPHPELQPVADAMRKMLDTWRDRVRGLGDGYLDNFIENYFPHYWANGSEAARMVQSIMGRRPLRGPASFLKMRTIPTIKEGMDAGLKPLTVNPLVMALLKTREMQRFVSGVTLMKRFKEDGLAQFLPSGRQMPDGWAPINDNIAKVRSWSEAEQGFIDRGQYIMPEDAARVINNHVSQSWLKSFAPATVFRVGSSMLNALQLGFSAFHLGFTTLDAIISKNALGVEHLIRGNVRKAAMTFGEAALGPVAAVKNVARGYGLLKAYLDPAGATPDMARIVNALQQAGGRAHMDRYYQMSEGVSPFRGAGVRSLANDIRDAFNQPTDRLTHMARAAGDFPKEYATKLLRGLQALPKTHNALEIPFELAGRIVRASTSWIMEHLVPMQKLGVFADLAQAHIERNPNQNPNERADAVQKIWASVDNRLGEMVYDNLFWNRTFKDILHFGIRAVGWNAGTVREIGGSPFDALKAIDKGITTGGITADDIGHKIPYVMAMTMTTALYGAMLNYLYTGEAPQELKDYFFPRTGGTTNYGTAQRVSLPSYVKDVYEYSQRPGTTVLNKLNPIFNVIGEMWNNEDFFGNPITDPDAGRLESLWQRTQFVGREMEPFSLQGRKQMTASEKPGLVGSIKKALPYVGITPAPGYVTSAEQMQRRELLEREKKYSSDMKFKLKKAIETKDQAGIEEYKTRYVAAEKHLKQTQVDVDKDRAKAAVSRRKAATSMRQQGLPATANLVASLPLQPDTDSLRYFRQLNESQEQAA